MEYTVSAVGTAREVNLKGRFTFNDHHTFRDLMSALEEGQADAWVFDLRAVEFIDSAGLGMLLIVRDAADKRKTRLVLRGAQNQALQLIKLAKFDGLFTVEE